MLQKMKHIFMMILFLMFSKGVYSQVSVRGNIIDENDKEVIGCSVRILSTDSTFLSGGVTNDVGEFHIKSIQSNNFIVHLSYIGYEDQYITCNNASDDVDMGKIKLMVLPKTLGEVKVIGSNKIQKIDRQILIPSSLQRKASSNGLLLLQNLSLPRIEINSINNSIEMTTGGTVELQINGVKAKLSEVKSLRPDDIAKVEYHDNPGLRYGNVGAVINIILKRRNSGGNFSVDLTNGINKIGTGDYNVSANYHFGSSSFKFMSNWERRDLKWIRENVETFNGTATSLYNVETGLPTKVKYDRMNFLLGYDYSKNNNLLSINYRQSYMDMPYSISDRESELTSAGQEYKISDHEKSRENIPSLDIYYQTELAKGKNLFIDVVGTYIKTKNNRHFVQRGVNSVEEYASQTKGDKYSLIAEAIYEQKIKNSMLSLGIKHNQAFVSNNYGGTINANISMRTAEAYGYVEFMSKVGKLVYTMGSGVMRTYNSQGDVSQSKIIFRPTLKLSYNLTKNLLVRYTGYISGYSPSLSDMNDVSQNIDNYQVRRGNPNLKTVKFVSNDLTINWKYKWLDLDYLIRYSFDDKPLMETTLFENNKYIRTMENQRGFHRLQNNLNLKLTPFGESFQVNISTYLNRYISEGNNYTHTYSDFGVNGSVTFLKGNWFLMASASKGHKILWGETLTKEETLHSISVGYNKDNWGIQAQVLNPFSSRYSQYVENWSKLAPYRQDAFSHDLNRIFMLEAYINVDFGKHKNNVNKRINNSDTNSGILSGSK